MKLQLIDLLIILAYLLTISMLGLLLKKRAQKSKGEYLLGGNKLPWYLLGLSNASGMFDISGTMWLVTALFVYGLKSIWVPWLWPVFNQIFLMVYLSAWLRRSYRPDSLCNSSNISRGKTNHALIYYHCHTYCGNSDHEKDLVG